MKNILKISLSLMFMLSAPQLCHASASLPIAEINSNEPVVDEPIVDEPVVEDVSDPIEEPQEEENLELFEGAELENDLFNLDALTKQLEETTDISEMTDIAKERKLLISKIANSSPKDLLVRMIDPNLRETVYAPVKEHIEKQHIMYGTLVMGYSENLEEHDIKKQFSVKAFNKEYLVNATEDLTHLNNKTVRIDGYFIHHQYLVDIENATEITDTENIDFTQPEEFYQKKKLSRAMSVNSDPLGAPTNLRAVYDKNLKRITLHWDDNSTSETSFEIEQSFTKSFTTTTKFTVPSNVTNYFMTKGITAGKSYNYRIRAKNGSFASDYSNEIEFKNVPKMAQTHREASTGEQKVLVFLVNFPDRLVESHTPEEVMNVFAGEEYGSLDHYVRDASHGKAYLNVTVHDNHITMPENAIYYCDAGGVTSCMTSWMKNFIVDNYFNQYDLDSFDNVTLLVEGMLAAYGSPGNMAIGINEERGIDFNTLIHEYGHTLGFLHSSCLRCDSGYVSSNPNDIIDGCSISAYCDTYAPMGAGNNFHFFVSHKEAAGYLRKDQSIFVDGPGTYEIEAVEHDRGGVHHLKIPIGNDVFYSVQYVNPLGYNTRNTPEGFPEQISYRHIGVRVHRGNLDMISNYSAITGVLGMSTISASTIANQHSIFDDPISGVRIEILDWDDEKATLDIISPISAPPSEPKNLTVTQGNTSAILEWEDHSDNEDGFIIERAFGTNPHSMAFRYFDTVGSNVTSFIKSNAYEGYSATYRVKSFNEGGNSMPSNYAQQVEIYYTVNAPTNLNVTYDETVGAVFTWIDQSNNEVGFLLERATNPEFTDKVKLSMTSPGATSIVDTAIPEGFNYYYRVQALGQNGDSMFSNTVMVDESFYEGATVGLHLYVNGMEEGTVVIPEGSDVEFRWMQFDSGTEYEYTCYTEHSLINDQITRGEHPGENGEVFIENIQANPHGFDMPFRVVCVDSDGVKPLTKAVSIRVY